MVEAASSGCQSLPYEVVFWDSEAPGHEGDRILFSESRILPTPDQAPGSGWRSDRYAIRSLLHHVPTKSAYAVNVHDAAKKQHIDKNNDTVSPTERAVVLRRLCSDEHAAKRVPLRLRMISKSSVCVSWSRRSRFPVEIGFHLHRPCRLQQVVVVSEPGRAPSSVECFLAGPARARPGREKKMGKRGSKTPWQEDSWRHNGSNKVSTEAARADYLSSMFVRIGHADFSNRVTTLPHESDTRPQPPGPPLALLSGLSFKGQFLRLVLWEPAGGHHNPGRQVTAVMGGQTEDTSRKLSGRFITSSLDEDGDEIDKEETIAVEEALAGLGIEPSLISGQGQRRQVCVHGREGEGGGQDGERESQGPWCRVVDEASSRVREMRQVAHAEERFNEAEILSMALDRVPSLAALIRSARRAQHSASRREDFDEAKRYKDKAMEAEVWLQQTVRDASETFQGGARGAADSSSRLPSSSSTVASTAIVGQARNQKPSAMQDSSNTNRHHIKAKPQPEEEKDTAAPFHDGRKRQPNLEKDNVAGGDGGRSDRNDKSDVFPPWLDPTCSRSTELWKGVLLTLPWPRGVRPDFRAVFSHVGGGSTSSYAATCESNYGGSGRQGKVDGRGFSTQSSLHQSGGLLSTVLRLVAASQDLRPPGPVPTDVAPFRRAGKADRRPPLSTFFYSSLSDCPSSNMSFEETSTSIQDTADTTRHEIRDEEDERFGRAFAHPAADATPSATAVINWVEDNPKLVWGKPLVSCDTSDKNGGNKRGRSQNSTDPGKRLSRGGGAAFQGTADSAGLSSPVVKAEGLVAIQAIPTASATDEDGPLAEASDGLARITTSFLPDVVGAGGFSEFVPLLEAVVGRVPMSAVCAGFPAKMRESAIKVCQAHLHRTADGAIRAHNAAAAAAAAASPATSNNARGAVFRAMCLVTAQGLMDPADGPRRAAECLAMSAMLLWASTTEAIGERKGVAEDDGGEQVEQEGGIRAPMVVEAAGQVGSVALPLRDLRWGLELVLACVAPYLADGIPKVADTDSEGGDRPPTTSHGVDSPAGTFDGKKGLEYGPAEETITADKASSGRAVAGEAGGRGGTQSLGGHKARKGGSDSQKAAEDGQRQSAHPGFSFDATGGSYGYSAETRSRLALRLVAFACRHPDIGPALVASILVTWIPLLVRRGGIASSRANVDPTLGGVAGKSGSVISRSSGVSASRSGSAVTSGAPAGETAASDALASGALHMLSFMVRTFPLLPLSDFSAETLAGAAEGGMAFDTGYSTPTNGSKTGANMPKHGRSGMARREFNPTAGGGGLSCANGRSSSSGRANHAGETLMLELFLHASTSGGGGGRLDFLDDLLPALNTARGLNFVNETSSTLFAETNGEGKREREAKSQAGGGGREGEESGGDEGEDDRMVRAGVGRGAVRDLGLALTSDETTVEIRKRLPVPTTPQIPMEAASVERTLSGQEGSGPKMFPMLNNKDGGDGNGDGNGDGDGHHSARSRVSDNGGIGDGDRRPLAVQPISDAENDGGNDGRHLPREDTTIIGDYPHMSDSSASSLGLSSASSSSIGSLPSREDEVKDAATPTLGVEEKQQALSGESKKANKVFPLSSFEDGGGDQKEVARSDTESNRGVAHVVPVATSNAEAGLGSESEKPRETSTEAKKDKKSRGGGLISKLFRRGKK